MAGALARCRQYFPYRSSLYITELFQDLGTDHVRYGSTRHRWVAEVIETMLNEPTRGPPVRWKSFVASSTTS